MMTKVMSKTTSRSHPYIDSLDLKLESIVDIIGDLTEKFSNLADIYPFATENIDGYLSHLDLKNKSVLTVGGSGDQIINSYFFGSNHVCAFDINKLAEFYSELKFSALEKLSFTEYKQFFLGNKGSNDKALDFEIYTELRSYLSSNAKIFFDTVYKSADYSGRGLRNSFIFNCAYDFDAVKIMSNTYLHSEENYNMARKSMPKSVEWINTALEDLSTKIDEKFDIIVLSNIADYAHKNYLVDNHLEIFSQRCIMPLLPHLNEGGIICAAYLYDAQKEEVFGRKYRSQVDDPRIRKEVFQSELLQSLDIKFSEYYFDSVMPEKKDAVVILQKQ